MEKFTTERGIIVELVVWCDKPLMQIIMEQLPKEWHIVCMLDDEKEENREKRQAETCFARRPLNGAVNRKKQTHREAETVFRRADVPGGFVRKTDRRRVRDCRLCREYTLFQSALPGSRYNPCGCFSIYPRRIHSPGGGIFRYGC